MPIFASSVSNVNRTTGEAFPRPPSRLLPISKGGDLVVDFIQAINGVITNYAPGVTVTLQIDTDTPIVASASITTFNAVCRVEYPVADLIAADTPWRVVVSYPTVPTTEVVGMNGVTERADT